MPPGNSGRVPVQHLRAIRMLRIVGETGEVNVLDFTQGARHGWLGGVHVVNYTVHYCLCIHKQLSRSWGTT